MLLQDGDQKGSFAEKEHLTAGVSGSGPSTPGSRQPLDGFVWIRIVHSGEDRSKE